MPTKAAWETAKKVVDQLLTEHYLKHGKFPETVGMVMWGTELLRTDAIAIAEFMYLLGVMPDWDTNGDVKPKSILIPLKNLTITINGKTIQRPRVDVFTTAVTGNEMWINLMNNAVKLAAEAPGETIKQNYVKNTSKNIHPWTVSSAYPEWCWKVPEYQIYYRTPVNGRPPPNWSVSTHPEYLTHGNPHPTESTLNRTEILSSICWEAPT